MERETEFMALYRAELAVIAALVIALIGAVFESIVFAVVLLVVSIGASIVFLIYVLKLGRYGDGFKVAGIFYVVYVILGNIQKNLNADGVWVKIFQALPLIFLILYITKFSNACAELVKDKDEALASSWDVYKGVVLFGCGLGVICAFLSFVPVLKEFVAVGAIIVAILQIVFFFWHLSLLKQTDAALRTEQ